MGRGQIKSLWHPEEDHLSWRGQQDFVEEMRLDQCSQSWRFSFSFSKNIKGSQVFCQHCPGYTAKGGTQSFLIKPSSHPISILPGPFAPCLQKIIFSKKQHPRLQGLCPLGSPCWCSAPCALPPSWFPTGLVLQGEPGGTCICLRKKAHILPHVALSHSWPTHDCSNF